MQKIYTLKRFTLYSSKGGTNFGCFGNVLLLYEFVSYEHIGPPPHNHNLVGAQSLCGEGDNRVSPETG